MIQSAHYQHLFTTATHIENLMKQLRWESSLLKVGDKVDGGENERKAKEALSFERIFKDIKRNFFTIKATSEKCHKKLWPVNHHRFLKALVPGVLLLVSTSASPFNSFSKFYCTFTCFLDAPSRIRCFYDHSPTRTSLCFNCLWSIDTHHHFFRRFMLISVLFVLLRLTTSGITAIWPHRHQDLAMIICMKIQRWMP